MAIFRDNSENVVEHDRSIEDRRRHRQLVEKSIKENLGDILSEESIIGEGKNKKFKIPIRGIKEYQFVYGKNSKGRACNIPCITSPANHDFGHTSGKESCLVFEP